MNNRFPFDIKNVSNKQKEEFFVQRTINHPILQNTFVDVMDKINFSPPGRIFLVYGPSGVGKSTLCKKVRSEILAKYRDDILENRSFIPVASIELPSPDSGKFNWKDFYQRLLEGLYEPLIYEKKGDVKKKKVAQHLPTTSPELRQSVENAIKYRGTKIVLLDEAQHLLKMASGRRLLDQMDAIKSLANITESIFIMFGTYELMNFIDLNGQLSRRVNEIHFRRYDMSILSDKQQFQSAVNTFQMLLPFDKPVSLLPYTDLLYERTVGCIGILKEWLDLCLKDALKRELETITLEILEKNAPSPSKALRLAQEAIGGEEKCEKEDKDRIALQRLLKLDGQHEVIVAERKTIEKRTVGQRKNIRDKTGLD